MAQHQISPLRPSLPAKSLLASLVLPGIYYSLVATPFASFSFHWLQQQRDWPVQQRLLLLLGLVALLAAAGMLFSLGWVFYRHRQSED